MGAIIFVLAVELRAKNFGGTDIGKCVYVFNYIGGLPFFKGDRKDNKFGKNIYGEE